MKLVIQNLNTGATDLLDAPLPSLGPGQLHVATRASLISAGTERMLVEFGRSNLLDKARAQPGRVRQVVDKVGTDGLLPTLQAVRTKLDQPIALGYCNAGTVLSVAADVQDLQPGDRVISNGGHAEVVSVHPNLCARIPDNVSDEEAAFAVLGAVALQGVRLMQPTLGESIVVSGLGLLGLMAVQILRANGCRVLGIDFNQERLDLARRFGAETVNLGAGEDPLAAAEVFSLGRGVDAVLLAASTKSNEPVHQAAQMCRQRGRIVLVGVTGMELQREDFYKKELSFQVSCSYGPGRYDPIYEDDGIDYPIGFVRWTEQRNFEAVLQLMADGSLDVKPLISHRVPFHQAPDAYNLLTDDASALGIILSYDHSAETEYGRTVAVSAPAAAAPTPHANGRVFQGTGKPVVGVIGAGNFAMAMLLPALAQTDSRLRTIVSRGGASAAMAARKFGFERASTDIEGMLADPEINTVVITTRHNSHARLVIESLAAGKNVFVEKPLCLTEAEFVAVEAAVRANEHVAAPHASRLLMVGFNRRFAPLAQQMAKLLAARSEPVSMIYTVNAGAISPAHWTQDPLIGGGRIIGEACHFIDLLRFLADSPITGVNARSMGQAPGLAVRSDKTTILLDFADGSTGTVHYLANGSKKFPKERVEVFSEGRVLVLDNFRRLEGFGWSGFRNKRSFLRQDKGHVAEMEAFTQRIRQGGPWPIPWNEMKEVTLASLVAAQRAEMKLPPLSMESGDEQ